MNQESPSLQRGECQEYLNPSARISQGASKTTVIDFAREASNAGLLFCPHCYEKLNKKYPVRFRNIEGKRVHFFHPKYEGNSAECTNWSREGEKHLSAKDAIFYWLQSTKGVADLSVHKEFRLCNSDAPIRQPDIYAVYPNGSSVAIEIQVSPINSLQIAERTRDIKSHGVDSVEWFLHGKNFNSENRNWCHANGVKCFHLWFEGGDDSKPKWKLDEEIQKTTAKRQPSSTSRCNYSASSSADADFSPVYVHPKKPGWFGKLYDRPWGLEEVMIDIDWVFCPDGKHKGYPSRYPIKDLIVFDSLEQARLSEIQAS